jgi:hypothetical protein
VGEGLVDRGVSPETSAKVRPTGRGSRRTESRVTATSSRGISAPADIGAGGDEAGAGVVGEHAGADDGVVEAAGGQLCIGAVLGVLIDRKASSRASGSAPIELTMT